MIGYTNIDKKQIRKSFSGREQQLYNSGSKITIKNCETEILKQVATVF